MSRVARRLMESIREQLHILRDMGGLAQEDVRRISKDIQQSHERLRI